MRLEISNEYGIVKLGDKEIAGVYAGFAVNGKVRVSEEDVAGYSGKLKQANGYEDLTATLSLTLNNDDHSSPYDKLMELVGLFRKTDKTAKPEIYNIVSKLTEAWGLDKVLFEELRTTDPPEGDVIHAVLEFVEWQSPLVTIESRAVQGPIVDRTSSIPTISEPYSSWQNAPSAGTYQDTVEVPDDD